MLSSSCCLALSTAIFWAYLLLILYCTYIKSFLTALDLWRLSTCDFILECSAPKAKALENALFLFWISDDLPEVADFLAVFIHSACVQIPPWNFWCSEQIFDSIEWVVLWPRSSWWLIIVWAESWSFWAGRDSLLVSSSSYFSEWKMIYFLGLKEPRLF